MNMEKCKYLLFCGTLALWMAGSFQQVYAATEPSSQAIQQQSNKVTGKVSDATGPIIGASVVEKGTANGILLYELHCQKCFFVKLSVSITTCTE